ncbi:hypothetical protein L2E82_41771 [Cichorium intybus]|uniref:Uncharacterized protein n=1 Tax=Cichorium intybus TaxID=13427 RepID=A0ACB8ZKT3_CICIN|nr:hypothetical protein L2E82_41771 [Cichorium intybus]
MVQMTANAKLKPINLTDDIVPRVMPFIYNSVKIHGKGKAFFTWMGPLPVVHVTEPALIREILADYNKFQKPKGGNPLLRLLARGVASADADQWSFALSLTELFRLQKLHL